jgi:formylglycine-generating enzyme required for sulfatase activity
MNPDPKSKIRNQKWLSALALALLTGLAAPAAQTPGTKQGVITYDEVSVSLVVSNGTTAVRAPNTTGHVGAGVATGTGRSIVWDMGADWNGNLASNLRAHVTADDGVSASPVVGDYMVIDLSGGTDASSYPVSYLTAVPSGGWTDEHKTTKLLLRKIPAGSFTMGSPTGELGRGSDETQHTVTLTKEFYIGVFEVTQRQWELVMGNRPSYFTNATHYATRPVEQVSYNDIRGSSAGAGWPANSNVDASSFMGKLREKTGLATFDLPTESQWEYACRAGTTTALNSGKNLTSTSADANMAEVGRYWYNGGSGYTQGGTTTVASAKAGSYLPNQWGLYDMHGNVWEWCLDWYGTYPDTVTDPVGVDSGLNRVLRGGGWFYLAKYCRSAHHGNYYPSGRGHSIGFRACCACP